MAFMSTTAWYAGINENGARTQVHVAGTHGENVPRASVYDRILMPATGRVQHGGTLVHVCIRWAGRGIPLVDVLGLL